MRIYLNVGKKKVSYKLWGKLDVSQMGEQSCVIIRPERSKKIYRVTTQVSSGYPFEFNVQETSVEEILQTVNVSNIGKTFLSIPANC